MVLAWTGRVVNIEGLGGREGLEEAVEKVQRSCLAEMFRVSMDRRRYAALGTADVDKGEEVALEEIRTLEDGPPVRHCWRRPVLILTHCPTSKERRSNTRVVRSCLHSFLVHGRGHWTKSSQVYCTRLAREKLQPRCFVVVMVPMSWPYGG